MELKEFNSLLGHTLINAYLRDGVDSDEIIFVLDNGQEYKLYHWQDCCESVWVEDVDGDLKNLIGAPLIQAEQVSYSPENSDRSETWTFYKLATKNGYVTIRWVGTSSGYYSEEVHWARIS